MNQWRSILSILASSATSCYQDFLCSSSLSLLNNLGSLLSSSVIDSTVSNFNALLINRLFKYNIHFYMLFSFT